MFGPKTPEEIEGALKELTTCITGRPIIFTNGCFDIFHAGHAQMFEWINWTYASKNPRIVVAVNSDESIQRLKGPSRPINNLANRMAVLRSISGVSLVIPFDEPTPIKLIERIRPWILLKSADYHADEIVGGKFVKSYHGSVVTAPYFKGISTTEIINKCRTLP